MIIAAVCMSVLAIVLSVSAVLMSAVLISGIVRSSRRARAYDDEAAATTARIKPTLHINVTNQADAVLEAMRREIHRGFVRRPR